MSGGNNEPLPFVRKFGSATAESASSSRSLTSMASEQTRRETEFLNASNVDVSGVAVVKPTVTGACRRCGFPGHHSFQCYNTLMPMVRPEAKPLVDISSTTSDDSEDNTALRKDKKKKKEKKAKKEKKKKHKKEEKKKRKRKNSSSSDSSVEKKKKKKRKRSRSRSVGDRR